MNFHSGIKFSHQNEKENCTKNRRMQVQYAKKRKLEEMIRVHVEAVRSTKNAAVDNICQQVLLHLEF